MKAIFKSVLAAGLLIVAAPAKSQTAGNILLNPDVEIPSANGSTFVTTPGPLVFGETAAQSWIFISVPGPTPGYSVSTELVPSDFMPGGNMLHVRAHNVAFVIIRPYLAFTPPVPHRAAFCSWVKVVRAASAGVTLEISAAPVAVTGDWQQLIVNADPATTITPSIVVGPQAPAGAPDTRYGDLDFYVATADLSLRASLSQCPRATLNDLSGGPDRLNLPPQHPRVEHPQWTDRPEARPDPDRDPDDGAPVDPSDRPARPERPRGQSLPAPKAPWGQK